MKKFKAGRLIVTLEREEFNAQMNPDGPNLLLEVTSTGITVDRPRVAGWSFGVNQRPIAERLKRCIEAGKAFKGYEILTDVNGKTYISSEQAGFFHKRHLNPELKRLGF